MVGFVAMIDRKIFTGCWGVGAANGASAVLRRQHFFVFAGREAVVLLTLIVGIAILIGVVALKGFGGGVFQIGSSPFVVPDRPTLFAYAIAAIVIALSLVELGFWLGLFADCATLRSRRRLYAWRPHVARIQNCPLAWLALARWATVCQIELGYWLGLAARATGFSFHGSLPFGLSKV